MSDYVQSPAPRAQSSAPPRPRLGRALGAGFGIFAGVFTLFAGYAFLAPAAYRTSAFVQLEGDVPEGAPQPLEAARRLHESVLDRELLERLAAQLEPAPSLAARAEKARLIRSATEIDTVDGRAFSVSFTDSDADRAESVCNQIAGRVAERLPSVLQPPPRAAADEVARQKRAEVLMAFLAAHPDVLTAPPEKEDQKTRSGADQALYALRVERDRVAADLAKAEAQGPKGGSDNPYVESTEVKPEQLRARLREIDKAMAARTKALETAPEKTQKVNPEVREQWRALVQGMSEPVEIQPAEAARPPLEARVVERAQAPAWPLQPNRGLLLSLGGLFGLVAAGLGGALSLRSPRMSRRPVSAPPPPPITVPPPPAPARSVLNSTLQLATPPRPVRALPPPVDPGAVGERRPSAPPGELSLPRGGPMPSIAPSMIVPVRAEAQARVNGAGVSGAPGGGSGSEPPESGAETTGSDPPTEPRPLKSDPPIAAAQVLEVRRAPSSDPPDPRAPDPARTMRDGTMQAERAPAGDAAKQPSRVHATFEPEDESAPSSGEAEARLAQKVRRTPKTLVLGSVIQPVQQARRSSTPPPSSNKQHLRGTGYSHVSSNPPSDAGRELVQARPIQQAFRPDPKLSPAARRDLCSALFPLALERCFVMGVSGTLESGEGKSRVAAELALGLAESNHPRVLLMEGNLNRPLVNRLMRVDVSASEGLSRQLQARGHGRGVAPWFVKRCTDTLDVLGEGFMRSPGLILTAQFEQCVAELTGYYDFVVIDGPYVSDAVDCRAFDALIDGVLLVCEDARTAESAARSSPFSPKRFSAMVPLR